MNETRGSYKDAAKQSKQAIYITLKKGGFTFPPPISGLIIIFSYHYKEFNNRIYF